MRKQMTDNDELTRSLWTVASITLCPYSQVSAEPNVTIKTR